MAFLLLLVLAVPIRVMEFTPRFSDHFVDHTDFNNRDHDVLLPAGGPGGRHASTRARTPWPAARVVSMR